jgi:hypothetical protein
MEQDIINIFLLFRVKKYSQWWYYPREILQISFELNYHKQKRDDAVRNSEQYGFINEEISCGFELWTEVFHGIQKRIQLFVCRRHTLIVSFQFAHQSQKLSVLLKNGITQ